MKNFYSDSATAILLDIEGTTTPVDYVFGVLFPFARSHVGEFLQQHGQEPLVQQDLDLLRQDYDADLAQGHSLPAWKGEQPTAAVAYIDHLIATDRKSTGLKSLQGKIWNQGYAEGTLRSRLFADVPPAFERWTQAGKQLFIFSSGSVQAQKLLFRYSEAGDLTPFLSGYFDTQTGAKKETASYERIAEAIGLLPEQILFISDVTVELRAAQSAGMQTLFSCRPGNPAIDAEEFVLIENFDAV
ncbi:MAG: acireductone synthase [Elainellaceae cyanobacterium]